MSSSLKQQQQSDVLWQTTISKAVYGDHNEDVTLSEPVLITGITILPAEGEGDKRQVFKAWARDINTPSASRFTALFGAVTGPCQAARAAQVTIVRVGCRLSSRHVQLYVYGGVCKRCRMPTTSCCSLSATTPVLLLLLCMFAVVPHTAHCVARQMQQGYPAAGGLCPQQCPSTDQGELSTVHA